MTAQIQTAEVALRGDAQTRADDIRTRLASLTANLNEIPALIQEAHEAGDWQALGYEDWPAYVHGEYHTHLVKLSRAIRRQWTRDLKAVGMTTGDSPGYQREQRPRQRGTLPRLRQPGQRP